MSELDKIIERTNGHTSGAWEVEEEDYGQEIWFGGEGCGTLSVNGFFTGGSKEYYENWAVRKADAELIAAAPKLLRIAIEQRDEIKWLRDNLVNP